jgi:hypothetical protein
MGDMRSACKILVIKSEGKRSFGRRRNIWEGNFATDV